MCMDATTTAIASIQGGVDWQTMLFSIAGSALIAAIVSGLFNLYTQIRAIKESGLYTKRAQVLDEFMKSMERLHRLVGELVSFFQYDGSDVAEKERRKRAMDAFNDLSSFYQSNRHYLPKELSKSIGDLCKEYKNVVLKFCYEVKLEGEKIDTKGWKELVDVQKNLTAKSDAVADEFRKMIGVR